MKDIIIDYYGITDFATALPGDTLETAYSFKLHKDDINNLTHVYDGLLAARSVYEIHDL